MCKSLGALKPRGAMKVKACLEQADGRCRLHFLVNSGRPGRTPGALIPHCRGGAPRAHTLGPERW